MLQNLSEFLYSKKWYFRGFMVDSKKASHHRLNPQPQRAKFQITFFPPTAGQTDLAHYFHLSEMQNIDTNGED